MTSIRQMKRRRKKLLSRFMSEGTSKATWTFDGDTLKINTVAGSSRKQRVIIARSYLRRILKVQKTRTV